MGQSSSPPACGVRVGRRGRDGVACLEEGCLGRLRNNQPGRLRQRDSRRRRWAHHGHLEGNGGRRPERERDRHVREGWTLEEANAISSDGRFIVGTGTNPDGNIEAWVATIPNPSVPVAPRVAFVVLAALILLTAAFALWSYRDPNAR